jgi:hypothetical protein
VADATPALRDVRPEVPEELERVIMTALAKSPDDRFPSAEALGAALVPFASAEGIAGPFSLRPSEQAFEIASSAMRRAPQGPRASDASDLLRLPSSRPTRIAHPPRARSWEALRTFLGTVAIGFGLATAATLGWAGTPVPHPETTTHAMSNGGAGVPDRANAAPPLAAVAGASDSAAIVSLPPPPPALLRAESRTSVGPRPHVPARAAVPQSAVAAPPRGGSSGSSSASRSH